MKLNEVKNNIQNLNSLLDKLHSKQSIPLSKPNLSIPVSTNPPFHSSKTVLKSDSHPIPSPAP